MDIRSAAQKNGDILLIPFVKLPLKDIIISERKSDQQN